MKRNEWYRWWQFAVIVITTAKGTGLGFAINRPRIGLFLWPLQIGLHFGECAWFSVGLPLEWPNKQYMPDGAPRWAVGPIALGIGTPAAEEATP